MDPTFSFAEELIDQLFGSGQKQERIAASIAAKKRRDDEAFRDAVGTTDGVSNAALDAVSRSQQIDSLSPADLVRAEVVLRPQSSDPYQRLFLAAVKRRLSFIPSAELDALRYILDRPVMAPPYTPQSDPVFGNLLQGMEALAVQKKADRQAELYQQYLESITPTQLALELAASGLFNPDGSLTKKYSQLTPLERALDVVYIQRRAAGELNAAGGAIGPDLTQQYQSPGQIAGANPTKTTSPDGVTTTTTPGNLRPPVPPGSPPKVGGPGAFTGGFPDEFFRLNPADP